VIIKFSQHARQRLALRKISAKRVEGIVRRTTVRFFDVETQHSIAAQSRSIRKTLTVAYQDALDERGIITAHPMSQGQITRRIQRGTWVKL